MKKYFIFIFFIFSSQICLSQIVYHKYDPPLTRQLSGVGGDTTVFLFFDYNYDSVYEYKFSLSYWFVQGTPSNDKAYSASIYSTNGNQFVGIDSALQCNALGFNEKDTIIAKLQWGPSASLMNFEPTFPSCNKFNSAKYLPIKISSNGKSYYGWILLKIYYFTGYGAGSAFIEIDDIGYNSKPGEGVIAGDTLTSLPALQVAEISKDQIPKLFPNPVNTVLNIENLNDYSIIQLTDLYGNTLKHLENNLKSTKIDFSDLKEGVYFLKFMNDSYCITRKVIKIR